MNMEQYKRITAKRIYLLTTEHLEDGLWFRQEEDCGKVEKNVES